MPFVKRQVEPTVLSRARIPQNITSKELDFITNHTLANIIHQLSSLSKHAEDLFDELYQQSEKLITRTAAVQRRVEQLQGKVTRLDANVEEISLRDITHARAFRSNRACQQQVVSRDTMPTALRQLYEACDPPPPLQKLTPYRTDGKDALKFYTDPSYFFELWRNQMLKETEKTTGQTGAANGAGGRHDGEKGRRGGRHKSPAAGGSATKTEQMLAPQTALPDSQQQREVGKVVRQPGTNRLDKYRQKAAEQEIINYVPGNAQMPSNMPAQIQYQPQQPTMYAAQQNPYTTRAETAFQQQQFQQQQQNATQQVYPPQQQQPPQQMSSHYQTANIVAQQQQQDQQQKPYPAFVVSGMAAIPPIIGALDSVQPTSSHQLWSQSHAVGAIPPLNNYSNINAANAADVVFPGHTPTSASSMLVDENGRPAPPTALQQQQMMADNLNYAMQQQQHLPLNAVIPSLQQQQHMTMSHVESALQQHQYIAGSVQPHANDIIYHTRTVPSPIATGSGAAVPPSSLPLLTTNLNSSGLSQQQQQRTITTGGSGGSPSRPMQPPPAPPTATSAAVSVQQQSNAVPSPLPPPSVGELNRLNAGQQGEHGRTAQQFESLSVSQSEQQTSKTTSIPPPPPPPLPSTGSKSAAQTRAANESDAPNLPAKAAATAAGFAASLPSSVKSPEFPPAPSNADLRAHDRRSDLLAEIRRGIALRKRSTAANSAAESGSALGADSDNVSLSSSALQNSTVAGGPGSSLGRQMSTRANDAELRDVAMLMARRIAIRGRANSDSESDDAGGFTGHSGDTDEWEDKST